MEFALEPESPESLLAALAFIDDTLGDSSPTTSQESNGQLLPSDWETSHEFMTDISSDASSPRVEADLATVTRQSPSPSSQPSNSIVTLSLTPEAQALRASKFKNTVQSSANPAPTKPSTRKKKRSCNSNKARDDLKKELTYLRSEAEELELKLQQLKQLKVAKLTDDATATQSMLTARGDNSRGPFVWAQTCARQLECRLRSERENARLKMLLEGQIQVARSLEKLLSKRTSLHPAESSGSKRTTTRIPVSRKGNELVDAAVFEELADGVEASYREVERVFASSGLERTNLPSRTAQTRDSTDGLFLEIFDVKVLPFSMHATGEAWWRRWNVLNPNRMGCHRLESTEDTIVEHFGMEMSDTKAKTTAKFYVQQILRRYTEENRVVVVWQSHIEPLEFSHKKLAGIRFREKGYVVIKPHQRSQASTDDTYTLVETCHIIKPDLSDQRLQKDARTGALAEFVLSATVANIAVGAEMIEGMLVDEALQERSRM